MNLYRFVLHILNACTFIVTLLKMYISKDHFYFPLRKIIVTNLYEIFPSIKNIPDPNKGIILMMCNY